mgnify:FL=1
MRKETLTMNYEDLYAEMQPLEKELKDKLAAAQRYYKGIMKDTESGDMKDLDKNLAALEESLIGQMETLKKLKGTVGAFDTQKYFESGDFAGQLLDSCKDKGIDVQGEYPVFEMFPYRIRIDEENQEIYLDRKKVQCARPQSLAGMVKLGRDKLMKASFNAQGFANELAEAYDVAVMKGRKAPGTDIYLTSLYKVLAPMARFRRDYDMQSFAYDLARLYISGIDETKDGRRFQFGPSRNNNKAIRILDNEGHEQFLAMIRFFEG